MNITTEQKFQYIIESKINGQNEQVTKLFKKLTKEQRKDFLSYMADQIDWEVTHGTIYYDVLKYCIELIY